MIIRRIMKRLKKELERPHQFQTFETVPITSSQNVKTPQSRFPLFSECLHRYISMYIYPCIVYTAVHCIHIPKSQIHNSKYQIHDPKSPNSSSVNAYIDILVCGLVFTVVCLACLARSPENQ